MLVKCVACSMVYSHFDSHECKGPLGTAPNGVSGASRSVQLPPNVTNKGMRAVVSSASSAPVTNVDSQVQLQQDVTNGPQVIDRAGGPSTEASPFGLAPAVAGQSGAVPEVPSAARMQQDVILPVDKVPRVRRKAGEASGRDVDRVVAWRGVNPDRYRAYQRELMRKRRAEGKAI